MKVPFHSLIWIQPTKLSQFWFSAFQSNSAATLIKTSPWYFSKQNKTNNEKRDDSLIFQMETNISQISKAEIDCYLESKTWIHTRGAVLFCFANVLSSFVAMSGNLLTITAVYKTTTLQTPTNFLISSLSLADFLVGLVAIPLWTTRATLNITDSNQILFVITAFIIIQTLMASTYGLCSVTLDRYIAVTLPYKYVNIITPNRLFRRHFHCLGVYHDNSKFSFCCKHEIRAAKILHFRDDFGHHSSNYCHLFLLHTYLQGSKSAKKENQFFQIKLVCCWISKAAKNGLHHRHNYWLVRHILDANLCCLISGIHPAKMSLRRLACHCYHFVGQLSSEPMDLCSP